MLTAEDSIIASVAWNVHDIDLAIVFHQDKLHAFVSKYIESSNKNQQSITTSSY